MFSVVSRGQGTIEYLIVLAVIVIVGLLVVSLSGTFLNPASQVSQNVSKSYWVSGPISVLDSSVDGSGDGAFFVGNNTGDVITITRMNIGGVSRDVNKTLGINEFYLVELELLSACNGSTASYNVVFYYASPDGVEHVFVGSVPLVVSCAGDVLIDLTGGGSSTSLFTLTGSANAGLVSGSVVLLDTNVQGSWQWDSLVEGADTNTTGDNNISLGEA